MYIPTAIDKALTLDELLLLDDEPFVRAAYQTLLGRPVDDSGLRNYIGQVRRGVAKEEVITELARSPEGRARGLDTAPGLQPLLIAQEHQLRCRMCRVIRKLLESALAPVLTQLRVIDNRLYRLERMALAVPLPTNAAAPPQSLPNPGVPSVADDGSVLAHPIVLDDRESESQFEALAHRLLRSSEAASLRRGRAPTQTARHGA